MMIKIFTYLDEGCLQCKYALENLMKIEDWESYFEIVDICVNSSGEEKTEEQTLFSPQSMQYGITEGPTVVIVNGNDFTIENTKPDEMTEEYFRSLISY
jgi:hypothetical protein